MSIKWHETTANNFYGRALSYMELGEYKKALDDTKMSLHLASVDSDENKLMKDVEKKLGISQIGLSNDLLRDIEWRIGMSTNEKFMLAVTKPPKRWKFIE